MTHEIKERRTELNYRLLWLTRKSATYGTTLSFIHLMQARYKLCKMLKDKLIERREVKDELEVINRISLMPVGTIYNGKGKGIIENLQDKQYTPRVLSKLFEGKED